MAEQYSCQQFLNDDIIIIIFFFNDDIMQLLEATPDNSIPSDLPISLPANNIPEQRDARLPTH